MANTTNYNWETPDDTDLVKDGALAIRTLGSSIDTTTKNLNPETTLGDIAYRSSTANTNTRLPIGTTGQVLTVAGGVPSWASPAAGGGKVLQVVSATTTTSTAIATGTLTDTTITATITPTLNTSTILVLISANSYVQGTGTNDQAFSSAKLLRGATTIADFTGGVAWQTMAISQGSSQTVNIVNNQSIVYKDNPASTSALTYKLQAARGSSSTITFQYSSSPSTIVLMEIGA